MALFDNRVHDAGPPRERHVGRPMPRFEDLRLVRGAGRYTDDVSVAGQAFAVFVRAPHAHADIVRIDTEAARACPGVVAVFTGADYVADGHIGMSHFPNPADAIDVRIPSFRASDDRKILDELQLPLARERIRYVGEAVAVVIAESVHAARDGADAVKVEYKALPAVTDALAALAGSDDCGWNSRFVPQKQVVELSICIDTT